nr:MAG TPA: hypothetical protein [Caudoviricetes sp.]
MKLGTPHRKCQLLLKQFNKKTLLPRQQKHGEVFRDLAQEKNNG